MNQGQSKSRRRRNLWIMGGLLAAFTVFGFFIAPLIVKAQLEQRVTALLGRTTTVGRVRVNPYAVSLTLEQFDVRLKDGTGSFLGWDRLYVNLDPLSSVFGPWTVGDIELEGFHVTAQLKPDGTFNFADIIERLNAAAPAPVAAPAPAKPAPAVRVGRLQVERARLEFIDQQPKRPFATTFGPVGFTLTEFVTTGSRGAPYHFAAVSEAGEKLTWSGTLAADPLESHGEFEIAGLVLRKYSPYFEDKIQADLTDGKLDLRGRYEAAFSGGKKTLKLLGGELHLRELKLVERATQQTAVALPVLDVTGIEADAIALKATVGRVALVGGQVVARREKDGSINLLNLLMAAEHENVGGGLSPDGSASVNQSGHKAPPTPTPAVPAKLPEFLVGEVVVKDFSVGVTDLAAPRPAQLGLGGIELSLKNVTLADGASMPLSLAFNWAPQGTVKVEGTVSLKPELKADLRTDVATLALLPLSPYVEQFINARITQGEVSVTGVAQLAMAGGVPAVTFDGGVGVDKFGLVDGAQNEELAGFGSLALVGLKAATASQLTLKIAEVKVAAPYARVLVNKDGTLNLATVAKVAGPDPVSSNVGGALRPDSSVAANPSGHKAPPTLEPTTPPTVEATATPLPKIEVGKVVITDGNFSFADRSLEPNVHLAVTQFGGTIAGLSSENFAKADVDLKASVDGAGPIAITGKLDPLGAKKFVDLKVDFKNVDLLPLSPYSGKYAGYELARGKLSLDVQAKLDGTQLDASNVITLNQFTFGAPVESPDATKLPVRLGVALLKDMDGKIVIDVPITGSIEDPSLRIGKVVWRVIGNLLTKAAVSPFALLGSMFGGGGDELAFQEFAPGGSELLPAEQKKLETMVKALGNRPGLSLAIEGGYDGPADTFILKQQKVSALVRGRVWEERHATDPNIPPPEKLEVTPEAQAAMVKKLFDEKFPPGTEFGAPLPKAPVAAAPPPAPKKGLFRRVVDVVTFQGSDSAAPKPAGEAKPEAAALDPATGPSLAEMTGRLAEAMTVGDDDLRALAAARAQRVRDYFLNEGKIAADRLFLTQGNPAAKENKGPRVFLSLQ